MTAVKTCLWLLGVIVFILAIWFSANRLLDQEPDPQRERFILAPTEQIPDDQNVAIGILGLSAPAGSDFLKFGREVKAQIASGASSDRIEELLQGPGTLSPTVTSNQIDCWLDPEYPASAKRKDCLPFSDALEVLRMNQDALDRYKSLYQMGAYSADWALNSKNFLVLMKLSVAEMHLALQHQQYENAYLLWRDQFAFIRRNLHGSDTWVGKQGSRSYANDISRRHRRLPRSRSQAARPDSGQRWRPTGAWS